MAQASLLLCYFSPRMPKRCVAAGCGNTNRDGISLFCFPKDPERRKKWVAQVKRTRDQWEGPSDYSVLCSCHFEEHCFEIQAKLMEGLGLGKKNPRLKADAIPTLFKRVADPLAGGQPQQKKQRRAYEKRQRARVSY